MKKLFLGSVCALSMIMSMVMSASAQESRKVEVGFGADLVSSYIWRGTDCGGTSVQPALNINYAGLSFGVWGSAGFDAGKLNMNEFDLTLGYAVGDLSFAITDYYFCDKEYAKFWNGGANSAQQFEGTVAYDFGIASLSVNTMFSGCNDYKADGDRAYSTYIAATAPFKLGDVDMSGTLGITPFESPVYATTGFAVCNCCIEAEKSLGELFKMKGAIVYNPAADATYFTIGLSF